MTDLLCPLCGEASAVPEGTDVFPCSHCGKPVRLVPYGRAYMLKPVQAAPEGEEPALKLVAKAEAASDPKKKKKLLDEALALCPDSLTVRRELLFLGRLWQQDLRTVDYHLIKCYLLHIFQEPETETEASRAAILQELTAGEELQACLALAADRDGFLHDYLLRLSQEYLRIFLKGSSRYGGKFMRFQLSNPARTTAAPAAIMIANARKTGLPEHFDTMVPDAIQEAFHLEFGNDTWLNQALRELNA